MNRTALALVFTLAIVVDRSGAAAEVADTILHNGVVATVDKSFSLAQALAVKDGRLLQVGSNADVLATRGPNTVLIDLEGRFVAPGLIDSHVHPTGACITEFDHPIPPMANIQDVLDYLRGRAEQAKPGEWIVLRQVFITRLKEQRYPTKAELDAVAPNNPVVFSTGPDASVNSLALKLSGIDKDFRPTGSAKIEHDATTGEPTGILRSAMNYLKVSKSPRAPTPTEHDERLKLLFSDYNSLGITAVVDRDSSEGALTQYARLNDRGELTVRMAASYGVSNRLPVAATQAKIAEIAKHPLRKPDPWLRIIGIKMYLDGGMLTGSAYMREPWGLSKIYSIDDPRYQGLLYMTPDVLVPAVRATVESGMQFTAHCVGDGAVHALLDAYEEVNRSTPVAPTRPCITHVNFQSRAAIDKAASLGVMFDMQPIWLYMDTHTLVEQFGYDRLRYFQPLKSLFAAGVNVGGGSDHMQKIGADRAVNSYDPYLGMWVTLTRKSRYYDKPLHPEEALSRQQALQMYTINNARIMLLEEQTGSLERGKLADFVVLDRNLLSCPVDDVRGAKALRTYVGGKLVYEQK